MVEIEEDQIYTIRNLKMVTMATRDRIIEEKCATFARSLGTLRHIVGRKQSNKPTLLKKTKRKVTCSLLAWITKNVRLMYDC